VQLSFTPQVETLKLVHTISYLHNQRELWQLVANIFLITPLYPTDHHFTW